MPTEKPGDWMIYGANGYTGARIARQAAGRGLRPVLAGRSGTKIPALAAELDLAHCVFPLRDISQIVESIAPARLVLNCAGPFSATAPPLIEACLRAGVHYLDITGEIDAIERAAALDARAREAGITLLPAVGFDVVPSDCLARLLADRLPAVRRLELAFVSSGGMSPGTAQTVVESLGLGGRVRIDGKIVRVPVAWKTAELPICREGQLGVTIPWGDVASAYYSTGIGNIEVYGIARRGAIRRMRRCAPVFALLRLPPIRAAVKWIIRRRVRGPSEAQFRASRSVLWGRVTDEAGRSVEATINAPGGYPLTVATSLASVEKVLAGAAPPGFCTPSRAFGGAFIQEIPSVELNWEPAEEG